MNSASNNIVSATLKALQQQQQDMLGFSIAVALREDPQRAQKYSLSAAGIFLDYSKNLVDDKSMALLLQLAEERQVLAKLRAQMAGEPVNPTESQAATHTAMRANQVGTNTAAHSPDTAADKHTEQTAGPEVSVQGNQHPVKLNAEAQGAAKDAAAVRQKIYQLNRQLLAGELIGVGGRAIKRVVNLGIGGSYLGGALLCRALPPQPGAPKVDFISSLSPTALPLGSKEQLEECLFILSSKSFSTEETLTSAEKVLDYYAEGDSELRNKFLAHNFYAITASPERATDFGISEENIFTMAPTIGGRFSLWSAIGMPIVLHAGEHAYEELLQGAAAMDKHSATAAAAENMPLLLALLSYWYVNCWKTRSICVNAYENCLADLPMFLQQLVMESCGKQATLGGGELSAKSEVLWGGEGTAIQHSYMQLCHQGNQLIPIDFIVGARPPVWHEPSSAEMSMQRALVAHCLAQSQALLQGRDEEEARAEAAAKGLPADYINHLVMPGNRPSNTLVYESLSPAALGALIALYEHKTALFAYLSDINPFDQWGVELGKVLSGKIKSKLEGTADAGSVDDSGTGDADDPSTANLIRQIRTWQNS